MSENSFKLSIMTPAGLWAEEKVTSVVLPSVQGEIGILPDHVPYTGLLGSGIMTYVRADDGKSQRLVVSGGFCRFGAQGLMILADQVDSADSLDKANYAKDRENLQKIVDSGNTMEPSWTQAKTDLARIEAIDRLIGAA